MQRVIGADAASLQQVPEHAVAGVADPPGSVHLAGLIQLWRYADIRTDQLRSGKSFGAVARNARLVIGPTPGIVINRRKSLSLRAAWPERVALCFHGQGKVAQA